MAQNVYDDPDFFAGYSQFLRSLEGLAGAPEWPVMRSLLPPLEGLRLLDLGCGFGAFGRWARENGAESVVGVDISEKMLERARILTQDTGIVYFRANMASLALAEASFDLVYSSLALHYLEDFAAVCVTLHRLLKPGGHLVFSVEHPIFTAPSHPGWRTEGDGSKIWPLDSYQIEGKRVTDWITPGVVKYHRTVSGYVNTLLDQGFHLIRMEEWKPSKAQITERAELADEMHRPTFLLIAAQAVLSASEA